MAEVLSQSQIDALLNSMQGDSKETKQEEKKQDKNYKKYDFYSPKKFTKDRMKIIKGIYDNYARIASSQLNGMLRTNCEMETMSVEEQRYYEFSNALSENDIMMLVELELPDASKNPPMLIQISQVLMVNIIDRMLGGMGNDAEIDVAYAYTDIEIALYHKVMQYLLRVIKDAWGNYIALDIGESRLEENPSLFQEISLDDPVAIVILKMKMQGIEGLINICIPGHLLTNIFSIIDKRKHVNGTYDNGIENGREIIMERLKESSLLVKAELGAAELSLSEVCSLQVGDVIDLNKSKDSDIFVYVEERPWFEGKLGIYNKNVAVRVNKRIKEEEIPVE